MKLYYSPGACSLSPHIVLREAGLEAELVRVDLRTLQTADGRDFHALNPKGYVPALELDDGQLLTEGPAIVQYLADLEPERQLAPAAGTLERYRLQEWLTYIGTELHKAFGPLFHRDTPPDKREAAQERLSRRLALVEQHLTGREFLVGDHFTGADAYLFVILRWAQRVGPKLDPSPALLAFFERVKARPGVQRALEEEGLLPPPAPRQA